MFLSRFFRKRRKENPVPQIHRKAMTTPSTFTSKKSDNLSENPIPDLVPDDIFHLLHKERLFNEKALRDYKIKMEFRRLRKEMSAGDAIDTIREEFPYLQFDTVRKIVYGMTK